MGVKLHSSACRFCGRFGLFMTDTRVFALMPVVVMSGGLT